MSQIVTKLEGEKPVQSVEDFDALLEAYKLSNPAKFEAKLKAGEFDKFRAKLKVVEEVPSKKAKK